MKHISKTNIALALILFSLLIILSRIQAYDGLLGVDTVTYAIMGNELLEGRALYSDLWDHKPPAIHLTFAAAQAMVGFGSQSFFLKCGSSNSYIVWRIQCRLRRRQGADNGTVGRGYLGCYFKANLSWNGFPKHRRVYQCLCDLDICLVLASR